MAEPLNLTIKVNTETGQLEVLGAKFREVGDQSKSLTSAFAGLTGEAKNLLGAFLPFASAAGSSLFRRGREGRRGRKRSPPPAAVRT
jgi:hypothetical protein